MADVQNSQTVTFVDLIDERDRVIGFASKEWAEKNKFAYRISTVLITSTTGELLLKKTIHPNSVAKYASTVEVIVPAGSNYLSVATETVKSKFGSTPALRAVEYFNLKSGSGSYFSQLFIGVIPATWELHDEFEWVSPEHAAKLSANQECSAILSKLLTIL
jgi:hypothetical protein